MIYGLIATLRSYLKKIKIKWRLVVLKFRFISCIFLLKNGILFYRKGIVMPTLSMFYGLIVYMYYLDTDKHKKPHIHIKYQGTETVIAIPDGEVLEGNLKSSKMKLLLAWLEIHQEEIMADWELAVNGETIYKIEPLK